MAAACRSATVGKNVPASAPSHKDPEPLFFCSHVDLQFTGEPGEGWRRIECVSKKAYGCGDLGQELVESLRLYVRFGAYPSLTSFLAIRMIDDEDDKLLRRIAAKVDAREDRHPGSWMRASGIVPIAYGRLILIILVFHHGYHSELCYYLVYDGIDSSLSLINYLPDYHETYSTAPPVLNRTWDGDFELVLLGRKLPQLGYNTGALCMCTTDSRANPSADGLGPWKVKGRCFPNEVREPFLADLAFTFQDKAFWANFSQGCLLYCDPHTCDDRANFISIRLPAECVAYPEGQGVYKMIRDMGYVGDSIWLVYIHLTESCADDLLLMWSLDLAKKQWKQEVKISVKSLWELEGFKKAGLPKTSFYYPVFIPNDALCLVLMELHDDDIELEHIKDWICCFDVRGEKLLWHGYVEDYDFISSVILPSNFFKTLPKHLSKAGLTRRKMDKLRAHTVGCITE